MQNTYVNELNVSIKNGDTLSTVSSSDGYPEFSDNTDVATATLLHDDQQRNITVTVAQLAQAHSQYSFLTFHPLTGPLFQLWHNQRQLQY